MYKLLFVLLFVSANAFAQPFGVDSRYTEKVDAFSDEIEYSSVRLKQTMGPSISIVWTKDNNEPYVDIYAGYDMVLSKDQTTVDIIVRVDKSSTETFTFKTNNKRGPFTLANIWSFDLDTVNRFAHILANNELIAIRIPGVKKDIEFLIHELDPMSAMFVTDKSNTTRADIVKFSKFVNTGLSQL